MIGSTALCTSLQRFVPGTPARSRWETVRVIKQEWDGSVVHMGKDGPVYFCGDGRAKAVFEVDWSDVLQFGMPML